MANPEGLGINTTAQLVKNGSPWNMNFSNLHWEQGRGGIIVSWMLPCSFSSFQAQPYKFLAVERLTLGMAWLSCLCVCLLYGSPWFDSHFPVPQRVTLRWAMQLKGHRIKVLLECRVTKRFILKKKEKIYVGLCIENKYIKIYVDLCHPSASKRTVKSLMSESARIGSDQRL